MSDDIEVARISCSCKSLVTLVHAGRPLAQTVARAHGQEPVVLSAPAAELLLEILDDMAAGSAVPLLRRDAELTAQQAADFLHASRPFLLSDLEAGTIPLRKIGTHRRVRFEDLRRYKDATDDALRRTLDEITADAQELGMCY